MRIWITGGNGSLGSALAVVAAERFPSSEIRATSREDLDLEDRISVEKFVSDYKPTHVFHLAAKVFGIGGHLANPTSSLITNSLIDLNVFSALMTNPPKWVYYASSVATYEYPYKELPLNESSWGSSDPHGSEYGYAMAKRHALSYLKTMHSVFQVKFAFGLTTNLFSINDKHLNSNGHVVISLLEKAINAKTTNSALEIWGTGKATRDFLSVEDASQVICDLVDQNPEIVNVASGHEISISQIADWIVEIVGLENGYRFTSQMEGITHRWCDVEKLKKFSSYAGQIDSPKRLRELINNFNQTRSNSF